MIRHGKIKHDILVGGETIDKDITNATWGKISGDISNQTDLINKINSSVSSLELKTINGESIKGSGDIEIDVDLNYYIEGENEAKIKIGDIEPLKVNANGVTANNITTSSILESTSSNGLVFNNKIWSNTVLLEKVNNSNADENDLYRAVSLSPNKILLSGRERNASGTKKVSLLVDGIGINGGSTATIAWNNIATKDEIPTDYLTEDDLEGIEASGIDYTWTNGSNKYTIKLNQDTHGKLDFELENEGITRIDGEGVTVGNHKESGYLDTTITTYKSYSIYDYTNLKSVVAYVDRLYCYDNEERRTIYYKDLATKDDIPTDYVTNDDLSNFVTHEDIDFMEHIATGIDILKDENSVKCGDDNGYNLEFKYSGATDIITNIGAGFFEILTEDEETGDEICCGFNMEAVQMSNGNANLNLYIDKITYSDTDNEVEIEYKDIATKTYVDETVGDIETLLQAI